MGRPLGERAPRKVLWDNPAAFHGLPQAARTGA